MMAHKITHGLVCHPINPISIRELSMADCRFEDVFKEHHQELEQFLRRQVGDPDMAADLLQDTFIRFKPLYENPPGVQKVRAYLFRIARNLVIDHFRREQVRRTDNVPEEELAEIPSEAAGPDVLAASQQRLEAIRAAVAQLPPRCREVFIMSRVQGMTLAEIGEALGISPKTAFSHFTRALQLLKTQLEQGSGL